MLSTRGEDNAGCFIVLGTGRMCAATTEGGLSCLASLDGRFPEGDGGRDPGATAELPKSYRSGPPDGTGQESVWRVKA
ncbi:hypothetical protein [Gluconobacter cerinus]|uniref:hypothetical protein n=1 Tax=Gluconobacter cerinus TaxID=38307 RepID=UPI0011AF5B63|nr:hypothetical protein [Gluconobacter cerinus]